MKKLILSCLSLFVFSAFVNAQSANEWMDKLVKTYQKAQSYYIKFEMNESGSSKAETGELFASAEKYNVEILDIRQMFDGKKLYTVSKEDREVTVSQPAAGSNDFLSPTKVLSFYKDNYNSVLDKTETVNGQKIQYLKLTPKEKAEVTYAMIGVNAKDNSLYSYKEFYGDGNSRTFTVKEFIENLIIPKALFKFDQSKYQKDGYIVTPI